MEDNIEKPNFKNKAKEYASLLTHVTDLAQEACELDFEAGANFGYSVAQSRIQDLVSGNADMRDRTARIIGQNEDSIAENNKLKAHYESRILELEEWKKQMLIIWSPLMDWMQSSSSMKVGQSISVEALKRCQEYEKQLVEISELKEEIERLKKAYEPYEKMAKYLSPGLVE